MEKKNEKDTPADNVFCIFSKHHYIQLLFTANITRS